MVQGIKSITLERQIVRADGTVEPLEAVAYWHKNKFIRAWASLRGLGKVRRTCA